MYMNTCVTILGHPPPPHPCEYAKPDTAAVGRTGVFPVSVINTE